MLRMVKAAAAFAFLIHGDALVVSHSSNNSKDIPVEQESALDARGIPSALSPEDNPLQYESVVDNANHWNENYGWFTRTWHVVDVVASAKYKFMYVENLRSGSWNIEKRLEEVVGTTNVATDMATNGTTGTGVDGFSSNDFSDGVADLFKFSVVLDPITKFEAGVRATWKVEGNDTYTADEMLGQQLHICNITSTCEWINEELQPSSWRLSTWVADEQIHLDAVAKIENIATDWPAIVDSFTGLDDAQKTELYDLGYPRPRGPWDPRSRLSVEGIQKMCASEVYSAEWDLFNYPKPEVCV